MVIRTPQTEDNGLAAFLAAHRAFLRPTLWRKVVGLSRRSWWLLRDWWRGPVETWKRGDVILIGGEEHEIERVQGRTIYLTNGSTLTC